MATGVPYLSTAYGLSDALLNVFPAPIVSKRDPTTADRAQLGTIWVNTSSNNYFVLTSIVANSSTWSSVSNGSGIFASLEATTGNITADLGDIIALAGNITADVGDITATAGNIVATAGNIIASAGNINATLGGMTAAGDITTVAGNLVATAGDVVVTAGNVDVTLGNITVSAGTITATAGDIVAAAGAVNGAQVEATGDLGGVVGVTSLTNVIDTAQSTGTLSILSDSVNPGNNAGFLKIYVGAATAYVPYFTNIAP